jgi:hypothetical protein
MGCEPTQYPERAGGFVAFRSSAVHKSLPATEEAIKMVLFFGKAEVDDDDEKADVHVGNSPCECA